MADRARTARATKRRPTIRDVARSAAVSPATVSNVLTGRRHVDSDRANRVRLVVDELGYQRNVAASVLRSVTRTVVGAVVPELANPFFAEMVDRLEREARAAGKRLLIATSSGDPAEETRQIEALIAWRPAGLIVVPCDGTFAARTALEREAIPFVVLDRPLDGDASFDMVAVDNVAAARAGAERLLAIGHRGVLVVASTLALGNVRERVAGIEAAVACVPGARAELIEAGLELDDIATAVASRLARRPLPTAIFTLNNILTLGTLKAASAAGIAIPDEMSLLGFDDYDWMEVFRPPLCAIRQPVADLAHAAWERLAVLTGATPAGEIPTTCHVRLSCSLVWRDSVARPRASASAEYPPHEVLPP